MNHVASEVLNAAENMRKTMGKKHSLTIRWTAGHPNIPGNESVLDAEAKKAAEGHTSESKNLPKLLRKLLKTSRSVARQQQRQHIKIRLNKEWAKSPFTKFHRTD
jgi:hypothetical protein